MSLKHDCDETPIFRNCLVAICTTWFKQVFCIKWFNKIYFSFLLVQCFLNTTLSHVILQILNTDFSIYIWTGSTEDHKMVKVKTTNYQAVTQLSYWSISTFTLKPCSHKMLHQNTNNSSNEDCLQKKWKQKPFIWGRSLSTYLKFWQPRHPSQTHLRPKSGSGFSKMSSSQLHEGGD